MNKHTSIMACLVALLGLTSGSANAVSITLTYTTSQGGSGYPVTGSAVLDFFDVAGGVKMTVQLTNTTNSADISSAMLTGFGIDNPVGVTPSFGNDGVGIDWKFVLDGSANPYSTDLDLCLQAKLTGGTCLEGAGSGNDGLAIGQTDGVIFTWITALTASDVRTLYLSGLQDGTIESCVRFQSINGTSLGGVAARGGSDKLCVIDSPEFDKEVPEPGTLALLGLGLLGLGLGRRRSA